MPLYPKFTAKDAKDAKVTKHFLPLMNADEC